jgi:hypothetical protein
MDASLPPLPPLTREESAELGRRRRGRNWAVFLSLLALSLLFYGMAVVKMGHF